MTILFKGDGTYNFGLSRGAVYRDKLSEIIPKSSPWRRVRCICSLILDDSDPYDLGFSVAAAILNPGGGRYIGGYLPKRTARIFRDQLKEFPRNADEALLCKAILAGGTTDGGTAWPAQMSLDLCMPLAVDGDWYITVKPFLEAPLQPEFIS